VSQVRSFAGVLFPIILVSALLVGVTPGALADQDSDGGSYAILAFKNGDWQLQGQLSFSDYETRRLPLDNGAGQLRIRLTQHGHDGAFVDYLALEKDTATYTPASAINIGSSASVLTKVMSPEYDVCDAWHSTLEVVWENAPDNATLVMRAMEEDIGDGHGVPLYYPRIQQGETLSYTLVDDGGICVNGLLQESTEPDFTVFWQPDSPHPDGYTYGWLHSNEDSLYAAVEVTADNTPDEQDWGALYLVVDGEMREFRVTDDQEQWGVSGFQYTSSVAYEHRVYEFRIPLNEIAASTGAQIRYGFGCYGTIAVDVTATPTQHSACGVEWSSINTPSWEDGVILPGNDILDYDISGADGSVIYVVAEVDRDCSTDNPFLDSDVFPLGFGLFKSGDGGVTWKDITKNVLNTTNMPSFGISSSLNYVAVASDDEDWVAVTGYLVPALSGAPTPTPFTVASKDGGDNFSYAGDMKDNGENTWMMRVYDTEVSIETDSIHIIAVCGINDQNEGSVFRLDAGTWLTGSWEDTSYYDGWDGDEDGNTNEPDGEGIETTIAIIDGEFSPNFDIDFAFVTIGVAPGAGPLTPFVQTGDLDSKQWGVEAGMPDPVQITSDGAELWTDAGIWWMGIALPADYDSTDPGTRSLFLYADAQNSVSRLWGGFVFRLDNTDLSPTCGPPGDPLLASIDVHGDADTGKMMVGTYADFEEYIFDEYRVREPDPCAGVAVWHTEELDFCCPQWDGACKNPSGPFKARVRYTPDGLKEYATTTDGDWEEGYYHLPFYNLAGDESAFSVSRDDAVSFNQIGLIDTDIDYLSDVAVCPDCSTIYLSSINDGVTPCTHTWGWLDWGCDSVWRSYDDGATWERVFHGDWDDGIGDGWPLLRLPCDAVEDCCDQDPVAPSGTIYVGLNDMKTMFYSRDCGQCWNEPPATKIGIQDFCVESENIVYVIDEDGMFSMSTQYGRRWSDKVDIGLDSGHSITCCCEQGFIVAAGAGDEPVAYSDDSGETWELTAELPGSGTAHIACDPTCEGTIYAALSEPVSICGGIYRWVIGESTDWENMDAYKYGYFGIVVAREGTLYAATDNIRVDPSAHICDRFVAPDDPYPYVYSGVARNLTPCETDCCGQENWDYLICGLSVDNYQEFTPSEWFHNEPSALRICGCLSIDTNSILWAIDAEEYNVTDGSDGSLWSYEDCAAKVGPTLTAPADGAVLDCEACAGCGASPFTLKWNRMCCSCSYDIEIMDEDGNLIVEWVDKTITGDPPKLYVDSSQTLLVEADEGITIYFPSDDGLLECGNTYTWKVREANTDCDCVHSPWSETWSFTVAVGSADAIKLLAPTGGVLEVPIENIGFSWTNVPDASSYSFVLSPNAAMTGALVSQDLSSTAFNFVGPLDYGKSYYWQVKAWKDSTLLTTSVIGVFSTMAEPEEPTPPVIVEPTPAPILEIPPAQQITPTWIYAIIGIGAALAVVVIVLIVKARRP